MSKLGLDFLKKEKKYEMFLKRSPPNSLMIVSIFAGTPLHNLINGTILNPSSRKLFQGTSDIKRNRYLDGQPVFDSPLNYYH